MKNEMKTLPCGSDNAHEAISVISGGFLKIIINDMLSHFQS